MEKKILVVDDDESIARMLAHALESEGYKVFTAGSADEGLELVRKENIPVSFLDLQLPGMNGLDLCRAIRKERPVDCVFALTGHASVYDLVECREAGFDDYFKKPVKPQKIVETANGAFDRIARWRGVSD